MPTAMTFTTLQEDLRGYLERGDVSDPTVFGQIPRLINNAEREIISDLKILGFKTPMLGELKAGVSVYQKPDRWRATGSMNYGSGSNQNERVQIHPRSYEYCRRYWRDSSVTVTSKLPKFYADYDFYHWLIVPTPPIALPWEIIAYCMAPLLDASNATNWLTDHAPTTLLYRSLMECYAFTKQQDQVALWKPMYDESKGMLNLQDVMRIVDSNVTRTHN